MSKVVLVTGAIGVLCSLLAKALVAKSHRIVVLDLRNEVADKIADEINKVGGKALGFATNVLDKESLETAKKTINKAFGICNILINGAGGNHPLKTN